MKTFSGIDILSVLPIDYKVKAIAGPYKGEIVGHDETGFYWESGHIRFDNVRFKTDGYFYQTQWVMLPRSIEFEYKEFRRLLDSKMIVRCDLPDQSRIFWNDGQRIATRKINSDKVSYSTFLFYDEMGKGEWFVYPEGGYEV